MTTSRSRFPLEIFFTIIDFIDDRGALLTLALTCQTLYQIIIPDHLHYFRISSSMKDMGLWDNLSQSPTLCKKIREFVLTPTVSQSYWDTEDPTASTIPNALLHMRNLRRAKFIHMDNLELLGQSFYALVGSKCSLEEIDLEIYFPKGSVLDPTLEWRLEDLPIWTKFDLSKLRRLAIWVRTGARLLALSGTTCIDGMLSNSRALTHLNITISRYAISVNLFDCTWPNLENLVIDGIIDSPSSVVDFFKRHRKLTRLSLWNISLVPPFITLESLPSLESLSYEEPIDDQVPLNKVLSPASARALRHLTVDAPSAYSNMDIYKELTSLQSCYITSRASPMEGYGNIHRILKSLVGHVPNLQKLHLPPHNEYFQPGVHIETCSLLQGFPKLTHLSVMWVDDLLPNGLEWVKILQELHPLYSLKYIILASHDVLGLEKDWRVTVFRVIRNDQDHLMIEAVSEDIPSCDAANWGGFYQGMKF